MRDAGEIRTRCADMLSGMLTRPGMYGASTSFEGAVRAQLCDLAFIDERDDDLEAEFGQLRRDGLFGPFGGWGVLSGLLGRAPYTDELAALYARPAARMGYFAPARRLTDDEWNDAQSALPWAKAERRSRGDVEARFGAPSYRRSGQDPHVFGYAGPNDDSWLGFHFDDSPRGDLQWLSLPARPFDRALIDVRPPSQSASAPEDVYRSFLTATLSGSERDVRKYALAREPAAVLWEAPYPTGVARQLADQFRSMSVMRVAPPDDVVYLLSDGCPIPLAVHRTDSGWRVDPRPLVRVRKAFDTVRRRRS